MSVEKLTINELLDAYDYIIAFAQEILQAIGAI